LHCFVAALFDFDFGSGVQVLILVLILRLDGLDNCVDLVLVAHDVAGGYDIFIDQLVAEFQLKPAVGLPEVEEFGPVFDQFEIGGPLDDVVYDQQAQRKPILVLYVECDVG